MRALISLGANSIARGDYRAALSFNREALCLNSRGRLTDYSAVVRVHNELSLINSLDGNHVEALAILSSALPIAKLLRTTHPHLYFDYLNNLAVDLHAVGRLEEATNACDLALASPFASAYPEWHETREEIETRKRSRGLRTSVAYGDQGGTQFSTHNNSAVRSTHTPGLQVSRDQLPIGWPEAPGEGGTDNLVRMPLPELNTRPFVSPFAESDARGRVLEFSSRTRALEEENGEDESDVSESRKTVADKLYEMLMAAIDGVEFDQGLVETLYRDYLLKRTCNG
jgi:tetratricopeptide (TPR) repeat protein